MHRDDEKGVRRARGRFNPIRLIDYWLEAEERRRVEWLQPPGQFSEEKYQEQVRQSRRRFRNLHRFVRWLIRRMRR